MTKGKKVKKKPKLPRAPLPRQTEKVHSGRRKPESVDDQYLCWFEYEEGKHCHLPVDHTGDCTGE